MTAIISIDGDTLIHTLDEHGWWKGDWTGPDGEICAHQAIRLCAPQPGDAYLVEQVSTYLWSRGPEWNDAAATGEDDVRQWLAPGIEVTDADLEATFGPSWERAVGVVRQAAQLTSEQAEQLAAAWAVEKDATRAATWAARDAERAAAWAVENAAGAAAWAATWAAGAAAGDAVKAVARAVENAARAAVTWDLATEDGPYTIAMRDLLYAPWASVFEEP